MCFVENHSTHKMALFTQEIKTGGRFTCAMPSDRVYVLVFESRPANYLTPDFVEAFCSSLSRIQAFPRGVVITASRIPEFYSNGISLHTSQGALQGQEHIWLLLLQLLRYPMPTITLISGQAAGLGFILALCHDFKVQKRRGSSLCIYEGQSRTPLLSQWLLDFVKVKLPASSITRSMLAGKSIGAQDSVRSGLVDEIGFFEDALRLIERRGLLNAGIEQEYCATKDLKNMRAITLLNARNKNATKPHRL